MFSMSVQSPFSQAILLKEQWSTLLLEFTELHGEDSVILLLHHPSKSSRHQSMCVQLELVYLNATRSHRCCSVSVQPADAGCSVSGGWCCAGEQRCGVAARAKWEAHEKTRPEERSFGGRQLHIAPRPNTTTAPHRYTQVLRSADGRLYHGRGSALPSAAGAQRHVSGVMLRTHPSVASFLCACEKGAVAGGGFILRPAPLLPLLVVTRRGCEELTDASITAVAQNCPQLQTLSVR